MISFSHNISPFIAKRLDEVETLRRDILATILPPALERKLKWDARITRVYSMLKKEPFKLAQDKPASISFQEVLKHATGAFFQKKINDFFFAHDYVATEWLVNDQTVGPNTLFLLHQLLCCKKDPCKISDARELLSFIQAGKNHPLIQAAIAYRGVLELIPAYHTNEALSDCIFLLFLYKGGYDIRGLITLNAFWEKQSHQFLYERVRSLQSSNLTLWIEYVIQSTILMLTAKKNQIVNKQYKPYLNESFYKLTDRQKLILLLLEEPASRVTNSVVQKRFNVSQITASRDLSKLSKFGLIIPHGKGRSFSYSRT